VANLNLVFNVRNIDIRSIARSKKITTLPILMPSVPGICLWTEEGNREERKKKM
jgi:hypothetical protein